MTWKNTVGAAVGIALMAGTAHAQASKAPQKAVVGENQFEVSRSSS